MVPLEVAATLLRQMRARDRSRCVRFGDEVLFQLEVSQDQRAALSSPFGAAEFALAEVEQASPDPLWESVKEICEHMEADHSDTFPLFLKEEQSGATIFMPWVERRGFFLGCGKKAHWIPFDQECHTPNEVRTNLIKMLRRLREQNQG